MHLTYLSTNPIQFDNGLYVIIFKKGEKEVLSE